jgi:hypothetical protein
LGVDAYDDLGVTTLGAELSQGVSKLHQSRRFCPSNQNPKTREVGCQGGTQSAPQLVLA